MTILEELIEFALLSCERGRASLAGVAAMAGAHHNSARGAAALGPDGKVWPEPDEVASSTYLIVVKFDVLGVHRIRYCSQRRGRRGRLANSACRESRISVRGVCGMPEV